MGACTDNKKNVWNKASLECFAWNKASLECFALIIYENVENC